MRTLSDQDTHIHSYLNGGEKIIKIHLHGNDTRKHTHPYTHTHRASVRERLPAKDAITAAEC